MLNMIDPNTIFSRNQSIIAPERQTVFDSSNDGAEAFGILPTAAQKLQETTFVPVITPPPFWDQISLSMANWFTTRVHLTPLGRIDNNG